MGSDGALDYESFVLAVRPVFSPWRGWRNWGATGNDHLQEAACSSGADNDLRVRAG